MLLRAIAAAAAALVGLGLWLSLRKKWWLPRPLAVGAGVVPVEAPLPPLLLQNPVLLDAATREDLVAGIGRYETDRPSRHLDVARTIQLTAAGGGVPRIVYRMEGEHRIVWLWIDDASDRTLLERVAKEATNALSAAGLRAEVACYNALPDRLFFPDGSPISAAEIESRKADHVVAVLTDGRDLSLLASSPVHGRRVHAVMRGLSRWPRLAIVDFGEGRHGTPEIGRVHRVPVVGPEGMVAFLADGAVERPVPPGTMALEGETRMWAAACALAPGPVDVGTAYKQRDSLGLRVSAWAMRSLLAATVNEDGRIKFAPQDTAGLRTWLWTSGDSGAPRESGKGGDLGGGDRPLDKALRFWRQEIGDAPAKWRAKRSGAIEDTSPAERSRLVDLALLDLWDAPDCAATCLHTLSRSEVGDRIRREISTFAPRPDRARLQSDHGATAILPWRWSELTEPASRMMLTELGLGQIEPRPREVLRRPGGFALAVGIALGLAVGGVASIGRSLWTSSPSKSPNAGLPDAGTDTGTKAPSATDTPDGSVVDASPAETGPNH